QLLSPRPTATLKWFGPLRKGLRAMPRRSACLLLLTVAAPVFAADPPTPAAARQRWLRGNYAQARALYQQLAKDPKYLVTAAVGRSRAWESEGEYDKAAVAVIAEGAFRAAPDHADLLARRAELSYLRGRLDDALRDADAAVAKQDDQFLARWVRARVL